jgi:hypothetical protein
MLSGSLRSSVAMLPLALCLVRAPAAAASEHEVRAMEHPSNTLYFDSDIDFEHTMRTDSRHLCVYQRPKPSLEELKAEQVRLLARYAMLLSEGKHLRSQPRCTQVDEPADAPADQGRRLLIRCRLPEASTQELNRWPSLEEHEPAGRFTVNGEEDGGIDLGLMGKALLYRHPRHSAVVISMISLEPEQPWSMGTYAIRKEATGESVRLLAVESSRPSLDFGEVGFVSFVIDTPTDGHERYVLEVHEKDGPRHIRVEGLTFEARENPD